MSDSGPSTGSAPSSSQKSGKVSTACGACKHRKTKCSGEEPCGACATRGSQCVYDVTADQRRKIANQRNIQELQQSQVELDKARQLLGGMIAILRSGTEDNAAEMFAAIRSGLSLSQLAAHVRNTRRSDNEIELAFGQIDFTIDGEDNLPSPAQILTYMPPQTASSWTAFLEEH